METYADILADLVGSGAQRSAAPFDLITVRGPDATEFLHRLCTQDIEGLATGSCGLAAFLDAKGKLRFTATIGRLAADHLVVGTTAEHVDGLFQLLDRYHFTEKLALERSPEWGAAEWVRPAGAAEDAICRGDADHVEWEWTRCGMRFGRIHASTEWFATHTEWSKGLGDLDETRAEAIRIAAGLVAVGRDTDEKTLGMEAHLEGHVSFDKGCYTGQEIVARIQTYGHVNRKLVALSAPIATAPEVGATLCEPDEGDPVGRWMTSASLGSDRHIALGYLPRDFWSIGTELRLGAVDGPAVCVVGFES